MMSIIARWLAGGAVLASAAWLSCTLARAAEPIEVRAGIADPVNTVLAWWTAQAAGFYAREGLKVEIVNMGGGSRGAEALRAGSLDVMHVGLSSVVKLNRAGGDLRLIGSLSNVIRFTFFSAAGVKTAADLRGGVVGVSTFGSESDSTVTLALDRLGLKRSDVTLKEYGGGPRRLAAVQAGEIKATALNEPFTSLAREAGVNVMVDLVPEQVPWLFSGITVVRSALQSRRDALTRFLKATIEGNYLALSDEPRAKAILASELKITDPKIIDISYRDFKLQSPRNIEPSRQGAENILAQFPDGSSKVEDYVDTTILDGLKAKGFFAEMERKYAVR
jgi:ABC-type nitrate/sulfonate/bicarbonate transport system substrate-binding protein